MSVLLKNISLASYTTYKIGGPAKYFAEAKDAKDIIDALNKYNNLSPINKKIFILGGGANTLFSDEGYDGLVLKISIADIVIIGNSTIRVGAGTKLQDILNFAAKRNLTGIEWMAGIPGSLGGAIRGNAGAFGREIKDSVISVRSIDMQNCENTVDRQNNEIMFGYRTSVFKSAAKNEIILSAEIKLSLGNVEDIQAQIQKNMDYRHERQPLEWPSTGSTFKNVNAVNATKEQLQEWSAIIKTDPVPVIPVAFLISQAGLKGKTIGGAMISEKHSNFFINTGNAKANDIKELINFTKQVIREKFNLEIEEEIQIVNN